jgi:hypothetical protein
MAEVALPQPSKPTNETTRNQPVNIMQIKREIETIKQKNEQRKKQLHEMFSHSYDALEGTEVKRPAKYMDTITERRNVVPKKQHNVSLDAGRGRQGLILQRLPANNPERPPVKTVRYFPKGTQESEQRSHRYTQSKELSTARR